MTLPTIGKDGQRFTGSGDLFMAMLLAQLDKFNGLSEYPLAIQSAVNTVRGVLK